MVIKLHSEHSECCSFYRRIERCAQAERQDGARIHRVNDAVIPQPVT